MKKPLVDLTETSGAAVQRSAIELRALVEEQASEEGLWFIAETVIEAYFQQELRRLHAAAEALLDALQIPPTAPVADPERSDQMSKEEPQ